MIGEVQPDYLVGQVISECKVLEKVGEGGFGTVYKAIDQNLQRPVALKVMLRSLTSNQEFVQKFIREAVTAAQLNHPNIVGIHKVDRDERRGLHYLIMEFVEGVTLSDLVAEKGLLTVEDVLPLMLQSCDGLATAHEHNIVHRDIKPENLMVTKAGSVKITDFGLAKSLSSDQKTTKVMGTPHYMSPEQFEGKAVDGRSDIYSLGVTFYYLMSNDRPYAGENTVQIIYSILTQDPKSLTEANDTVPPGLWKIIEKMIAKSPDDRYQTLRDTIEDLRKFRDRHLASRTTCPECSAKNPKSRKFCRGCGAPLLVKCPACDSLEPVGISECSGCGAAIERLVRLDKSLKAAKRFETLGDLRRAAESYRQVVEIDPEHEEAVRELSRLGETIEEVDRVRTEADTLMGTGEVQLALSRVEELMSRFPGAAEVRDHRAQLKQTLAARKVNALLGEAEELLAKDDIRGALDVLEKALKADPARDDVRARRDELAQRLSTVAVTRQKAARAVAAGRFEDAFQFASEVLRMSPGDTAMEDVVRKSKDSIASVDEFIARAQEKLDQGDVNAALAEFEAALSLRPGDPRVYGLVQETRDRIAQHRERLALCRKLMAEREFREAARGLKGVLETRPDDVEARSLLAACEKGLEETVRVEQVDHSLREGRDMFDSGNLSGALAAYAGVLQLDPNNEEARSRRGLLEARLREERDVRTLADEHLQDGRYDEAVQALQRLREVNPAMSGDIDREIAEAKRRAGQVSGNLARAEESLGQRAYKRARESASSVLELAPRHPRAMAVRKDAEKALNTINRFLGEGDRLIASELFDDAIESLDKAKARGCSADEYRSRREQCEQGRMALLKSDATRSLVVKDFEAAIAAYEQVLEVNRSDSDALRGKRTAERRVRIMTTEPIALRIGSAAVVMMLLGLIQISAIGSTNSRELTNTTELISDQETARGVSKIVPRAKLFPELTAALDLESKNEYAKAAAAWTQQAEDFPDNEELRLGARFNLKLQEAAQKARGRARDGLDTLEGIEQLYGQDPNGIARRKVMVAAARDRYVEAWFVEASERETVLVKNQQVNEAIKVYTEIESNRMARDSEKIKLVRARGDYLTGLKFGDQYQQDGEFDKAAEKFQEAVKNAPEGDVARQAMAQGRVSTVSTKRMVHLKQLAKSIPVADDQRTADEQFYDVIVGLQQYGDVLQLTRDQVKKAFEE